MSRLLPLLALQTPGRDPQEAVRELGRSLEAMLEDFPASRLVVLPEYHLTRVTGRPAQRAARYRELAEPLDGPRVDGVRDIARRLGIWLVPGSVPEAGPDGQLFNTTMLISPDGEIAGSYRKIFPWRPFEPFDMGTGFTVVDLPGVGRVGLAICYDLWFPEVTRQLAHSGAELIVVVTQTSTRDREQELVLARAAAISNQLFVLSLNAAAGSGVGRSLLVDPEGLVRWQAPSENRAVLTDVLDLDAVTTVREYGTCGLNRLWHQLHEGDPVIPLPVYGGTLDPATWRPAPRPGTDIPNQIHS